MNDLVQLGSNTTDLAGLLLKPSFVKFIQGTTRNKMNANTGDFYDLDTGAAYRTLSCALLAATYTRVLFPQNETHSEGILCKSENGETPADYVELPKASICAACPHQYEKHANRAGKLDRSAHVCKRSINLAVIAAETQLPHYLNCNGTSEAPAKAMLELAYRKKRMEEARLKRQGSHEQVHLREFIFQLSSVVRGHRAEMVFGEPRLVTPQDIEVFGPLYLQALTAAA